MINKRPFTKCVIGVRTRTALPWSLMLLVIVIMLALIPGFLGYRPVRTFGSSMEPALHDGDALLVKHVDAAKVRVGDIVTLQHSSGERITHRVVRIEPRPQGGFLFQTKGDANQSPEWWVVAAEENIAVAFVRIPFMGRALDFIQTTAGGVTLVVNAIALLVILTMIIQRYLAHKVG
ncbi:signal peptidase I [Chloroflexota bacterium]